MKRQIFSKQKLIAAGYKLVNPGNSKVHLWVKITQAGHFLVGKGLILVDGFAFAVNAAYDLRMARAEAVATLMQDPKIKAKVEQVGAMIQAAENGEPMVAGFWDSVKLFGKSFYKGVKGIAKKIGKAKILRTLASSAAGILKNPMIQKMGAIGLQALGVPLPIAQMGTSMLASSLGDSLSKFGRGGRSRSRSRSRMAAARRGYVRRRMAAARRGYVRRGGRYIRRHVSPPIRQLSRLGSRHAMSAIQSMLPSSLRGRQGLGSVMRSLEGFGGLRGIAKALGIGGHAPRQICAGYSD